MKYLVDTGVLLRLFDSDDPHCDSIRTAFRALRENRDEVFFAVQNASEFWNVSTRPTNARGGYGHEVKKVGLRLQLLERFCNRVVETHASYEKWLPADTDHTQFHVNFMEEFNCSKQLLVCRWPDSSHKAHS